MPADDLNLYLSQYLGLGPEVLEAYGAFDVSVASDLSLFVDPFLLFHSDKPEFRHCTNRSSGTSASCATWRHLVR